jgi:anaerobic selenocysteine-containing dehydrogenase
MNSGLNRRSFLKTSAAASVAMGLSLEAGSLAAGTEASKLTAESASMPMDIRRRPNQPVDLWR